ncbi:MAG: 5-formyltetrahydrofolate cyclo-ligase [Ignisphaera sp.]|nr:5-formyltetrahydrofolate cyclo-ligase [Ignisphaera sp.]
MLAREFREGIRRRIWSLMESENIALFPRPVYGRIPNFVGAEEATYKFVHGELFKKARVVKVNPDAPQRAVREAVLRAGKVLIMPTPRISKGFLILDPRKIPGYLHREASTIAGALRYGTLIDPDDILEIDIIVAGSVAVSIYGERLGKGEGYSELEYAILSEYGKVSEETPIVTTVHDVQVLDLHIPLEPWDITVDYIHTPSKSIKCIGRRQRPSGILWHYLEREKIESIPLLKKLWTTRYSDHL